eukprot:Nitzschia sp. Nitz4//scaffold126_size65214//30667//31500//NITZ4_006156-RA/size65214-processed-gene-0.38-mRNA-1//-1//CDS//3329534689//9403//frame0
MTDHQEEDWSEYIQDISGRFAQHETESIQLPNGESIRIASTNSLSPLDMMDLSYGRHDATGHRIWMGAKLFIESLEALKDFLPSRFCCIELGSGTGLAGIALAKTFGENRVPILALTDNSTSALELCERNCDQNGVSNAKVELLEWGSPLPCHWSFLQTTPEGQSRLGTVVFATDVLYDIAAWEPMLQTVNDCLSIDDIFVLSHVPRAALPKEAEKMVGESYGDKLEAYLIEMAKGASLLLRRTVRPNDLTSFPEQRTMEEVGASILLFQKVDTVYY